MARFDLTDVEWELIGPCCRTSRAGLLEWTTARSERHILGVEYRVALARPARSLRPLDHGLQPLQSLGQGGCVGTGVRGTGRKVPRFHAVHRLFNHPGPPARGHG